MGMQRFRAQQIWNRPLDVMIGRSRFRTVTASGTVGVEFMAKLFPSSGRQMVFNGRVQRQSTTFIGSVNNVVLLGDAGFRLQTYWKFQYDIDIGRLYQFGRLRGARFFAGFKVAGVYNVIQSFDILPDKRRGRPHTAMYRSDRGDARPRGSSPWSWELNNNRTVRNGRSGPSIETATTACLPVDFSGSLSADVSATVGTEMGWDLGPAITGNASVTTGAGASVDWQIRRELALRMNGAVNMIAST